MSNRPVPKPRPPPKPDITALPKKPTIPPKPRRMPPSAPVRKSAPQNDDPPKRPFKPTHLSRKTSTDEKELLQNSVTKNVALEEVDNGNMYEISSSGPPLPSCKNDANDNDLPKRPFKPAHLSFKDKRVEKELSQNDVPNSKPMKAKVNDDGVYDDVRVNAEDSADNSTIDQEELYIDVLPESRDDKSTSQEDFYDDVIPDSNRPFKSEDDRSNGKGESAITSRLPPPTKPPPKLPQKPVSEITQKLKDASFFSGKETKVDQDQNVDDKDQQKATANKQRPQVPPKPQWAKTPSKSVDENDKGLSIQTGASSPENAFNSDGLTSKLSNIVESNELNGDKLTNDCTLTNDGSTEGDDQSESRPARPIKKRIATRRQNCTQLKATSASIAIAEAVKRRPPPPPPEDGSPPKRSGSLKGPEITTDHLRVSKPDGLHKAKSAESIPKTAEDQSLYSYAYGHAFIPQNLKTTKDTKANNSTVLTQDESYVQPDSSCVAEFVQEINSNETKTVSEETYEIPFDEGAECQQSYSFISESEYVQPNDIIKEEDSDVSDSDGEPDYEVPPDSPPPIPPHRSPLRSGSYDITSPDDEESDYDDESDDYVEPPDAQGPFSDEDSDEDSDPFIGDESSCEEPLYQVYTARTLKRDRTLSRRRVDSSQNETSFDDLTKGTLRNMRMLWCEVPEVIASGILETIDGNERKRQEAMFEVITSEASYLKSLKILESHFINSPELTPGNPQCVIEKAQHHILFSNVKIVAEASQRFLERLRQRSSESVVVSTISDIIDEFATKQFEVYVKYCSNQIHQDRELKELRKVPRFLEGVERLEKSTAAQSLSLQSFLVLPMQRITRLPLLVDAICHRCEAGSEEFLKTDAALKAVHKIVRECNEGARKMERMEEMVALQPQIEFTIKPIALVSANRWLLRRGEVVLVIEQYKSTISKKKLKFKSVYMFLFNDLLLITKKKGENRYRVLDYAARNMTKVEESRDSSVQMDHMLSLILLENCNNKTKDFLLSAESKTDKTRWLEAFNPPKAEREGEKVYGAWDCPQVQAIHHYTPQQPDELALHEGDVINVQRKLPDGWHYGERLCDGVCGWFPANYTENILNEHVRARNLLQRYRLLAASKHLIGTAQTMKTQKSSKLTLKAIIATLKDPKRDTFS